MVKLQYIGRYIIDGRPLGKGNFANVELATHGVTRTKVAIKIIDTKKIKEDYVRQNLYREARILAKVRHPNVIRLYETIKSSTLYCLVTEYAGGGQLLEFVRSHRDGRLNEEAARPFVRQLISALHHLHERGIVHRDLKMENIILDQNKRNIKIVDFGLSNTFQSNGLLQTHCGSPEYAAPELFVMGTQYASEVDIWSLGINMYAMVVGKLPFITLYTEPHRRQKLLQQIQYGLTTIHQKDMEHLTPVCRELLHSCIEPNPDLRAPLLDIEVHDWVTKMGSEQFCPYQPPPKDKEARKKTIERMSELVKMSPDKLECNVHEFRVDDISAMYNMMMDQYQFSKRTCEIDHTIKRQYKRQPQLKEKEVDNIQGKKTEVKEQVVEYRTRTPTPIMLTKPSLYDPDIRNRKKGKFYIDFELSMDRYPNNKARTYPDESRNGQQTTSTGSNTKPFRNNNIIECSRSQKSDKPGSQLSTDCDMKEPITDSVSSVSEKDKMNEPITDKVSSVSRKDKMKEPITDSVPSVSEKDKICEDLPKLSIINMDHFLVDGFKLKTSTAPFDVMRRQSTRSRHFEETLNTMNDRTLMTNDNIKSNTLNHGTSNTLDNKAAHVCDSDTDVGTDSWKSGVVMETNQENAEGKDVTIETDTKEISSGDSYQSKDKRIEKWLQSTQEPPQHSTTTVKSTSYQPQRSTTISHSSETPRRLYQTNIATLQSRDMFHSRQSFKSASSRASSCRSVPKPSPWKQQYNVTTLSNPSSLKYKSYKKSVGNYGNNYSLVHSMRKCNVGRTPPVKGDSVYQTVPDSHLMLISSTPSTRTDSPDVSAWPDQSEKTYTLTTPKRSITNVTSLKNSERSKMDKYKGSTTYNDLGKYKRDNFARERDHNNAQLKIYSLIKQEEETKHKRQLVLLHQQELQKKNQTQRSKKQSDCSSKPERIESHYSHPAVSTASHRTYGIDTARCKSAAFNGSLRKNKPVAIVTPRTVRVQPRDTTYLAITSRPVPSITKSENYHKPGFSLLGSQNTKAVKFPVSGKIEKNSWTQSKPEQSSEWDTSYRLQRQVSSILKGTSHISQLRQVSKAESFYSTLSVK